ncbi:MAG: sugar ABC transporter ATP-binding protein [Lachnospiraceae bacterium]|jgi:ribose transport system ATP-binding protein
MPDNTQVVLALEHITKLYPGVVALDDVSLNFRKGEVHALVGENGAGKSTLIKAVAGAIRPDEGLIRCGGEEHKFMTPALSRSMGIEVVYQEFNLIDPLSAGENICLGDEDGIFYKKSRVNKIAQKIFDQFKIDINPNTLVRDLPSAHQQIVEISKAVSKNVRILILDEPTAPLTVAETDRLFEIVEHLKSMEVTIIYISHRLDEIFRISDRVSVLRDGKLVKTLTTAKTTRKDLISLMVGRELTEIYPERMNEIGEEVLRVENITTDIIKDISFTVHKGEILGISGLVGAGRTELARAVFGADRRKGGEIYVNGEKENIDAPSKAIKLGIGLIPEDRKRQGVFLKQTILWNSSIVNIKNISRFGIVDTVKEKRIAEAFRDKLEIRTPSLYQEVRNLSGGNQQKVVITKTLAANSDIVFFDEPTRGVDVGARREIYLLMNQMTANGNAIIMITSDMEELLGMSDRIIVLCEGKYAGEVPKSEFCQERILELASGGAQTG